MCGPFLIYQTDSVFEDELLYEKLTEVVLVASKFLDFETFELVNSLVKCDFLNFSTWSDVLQTLLYQVELKVGEIRIILVCGQIRFVYSGDFELMSEDWVSLGLFYETVGLLEDVRVRGGGGNSFISSKIKNLGTGGKSKVVRSLTGVAPLSGAAAAAVDRASNQGELPVRAAVTQAAGSVVGGPDSGENVSSSNDSQNVWQGVQEGQLDSENIKKNFLYSSRPNVRLSHTYEDLFTTNLLGQVVVNPGYRLFKIDCHGNPFCGLVCVDHAAGEPIDIDFYISKVPGNDPLDIGTPDWLNQYANYRGLNFACIVQGRLHMYVNNPGWKFVVLQFEGEPNAGHWVLCGHETVPESFSISDYLKPHTIYQWLFGVRFVVVREWTDKTYKVDQRCMVEKRDKIEVEETYSELSLSYHFFGFRVWSAGSIVVSKQRFLHVMREAELLPSQDRLKALGTISRLRGINTKLSANLLLNTKYIAQVAIERMPEVRYTNSTVPVAFNSSNFNAVIPNLNVIVDNQIRGLAGGGTNHVINPRIKNVKTGKAVGWGGVL